MSLQRGVAPVDPYYYVSETTSGLLATLGLQLSTNGSVVETHTTTVNETFTFAYQFSKDDTYAVTVSSQLYQQV